MIKAELFHIRRLHMLSPSAKETSKLNLHQSWQLVANRMLRLAYDPVFTRKAN
jgi:hypothetical protein